MDSPFPFASQVYGPESEYLAPWILRYPFWTLVSDKLLYISFFQVLKWGLVTMRSRKNLDHWNVTSICRLVVTPHQNVTSCPRTTDNLSLSGILLVFMYSVNKKYIYFFKKTRLMCTFKIADTERRLNLETELKKWRAKNSDIILCPMESKDCKVSSEKERKKIKHSIIYLNHTASCKSYPRDSFWCFELLCRPNRVTKPNKPRFHTARW